MIKIGVISDTHIVDRSVKIPQKILDKFKEMDMVIHAGDEVRRIGKPYARIMTKVGSNDMYDDPRGGKVMTSKEEWGEPMIPEGARDYVLIQKPDPKKPGI